MKFLFYMLLLFFSSTSVANTSNVQKNLRNLFTSPSDRSQLNILRDQGKLNNQKTIKPTVHKPIAVNMQGVVIRKNHSPIIFINNHNNLKSNNIDKGIIVKSRAITNKNYIIPLSVNQQIIKLKPGQQWHESDKTINGDYFIKVNKSRAKK